MCSTGTECCVSEETYETSIKVLAHDGAPSTSGLTKPILRIQPPWFKPLVVVAVTAAHIGAIVTLSLVFIENITPTADIQVELTSEGETVTEVDVTPTPDAAPLQSQLQSDATAPVRHHPQDDVDELAMRETALAAAFQDIAMPTPEIKAPDSLPLPVLRQDVRRKLLSAPREDISKDEKSKEAQEARRAMTQYAQKRAQAHAPTRAAYMQSGAAARRAGVRNGGNTASQMSNAAYAARVAAEINRHKFYPGAAGADGSVGVAFSIGPSGVVISHSIINSSGNRALDAAAGQIVASSHPPPPPGGRFRGATTIHFNLQR